MIYDFVIMVGFMTVFLFNLVFARRWVRWAKRSKFTFFDWVYLGALGVVMGLCILMILAISVYGRYD